MDAAFKLAAQPKPHRVLRLTLHPFQLGHSFLLFDLGSPFADNRESATLGDLTLATLACSMPHEDTRKSIGSFSTSLFCKFWGFMNRKAKVLDELFAFEKYLSEESAVPGIIPPKSGQGRTLNAPAHWRLLVMLMADFHMTEREALNTTMLRANCLWATQGDRLGTLELVSERRRSLHDFARKMDAQKFGVNN